MVSSKQPINPFYVLCVVAGVIFSVTACAYGLLMVRANRGLDLLNGTPEEHPLMSFLNRWGMIILGVERCSVGGGFRWRPLCWIITAASGLKSARKS